MSLFAVRWGGEEFAVLLPNTGLVAAFELASRIRLRVSKLELAKSARVTISAGVGEFALEETESAFLDRIDRALYQAKLNGRDRVILAAGGLA